MRWAFVEVVLKHPSPQIASRVGTEVFPLIDQYYYASYRTMQFTPDFPLVVKVGHAEAGYGKMLFSNNDNFKDFVGCLALHSDYATAEPFLADKEYDIRVQKIGSHYRAYTRRSSNWKTNVGTSILTEVTDIPRHWIRWAELASTIFGGLDILTVDAMHKNGKEFIIEINDTASGFAPANKSVDMQHVVDLCVERMDSIWSKAERLKKLHELSASPIPTSNRIAATGSTRSNKSPSPQ
jgi:synapsin